MRCAWRRNAATAPTAGFRWGCGRLRAALANGREGEQDREQDATPSRAAGRHGAHLPPDSARKGKPLVRYKSFRYQAKSWTTPRRIVAKVEHHRGELFARVGFIVTNMVLPSRLVVRFYNKRGTAEQWIKEGKQATHWTRLSCHRFRANEVRLQLSVLAYNLGLPGCADAWRSRAVVGAVARSRGSDPHSRPAPGRRTRRGRTPSRTPPRGTAPCATAWLWRSHRPASPPAPGEAATGRDGGDRPPGVRGRRRASRWAAITRTRIPASSRSHEHETIGTNGCRWENLGARGRGVRPRRPPGHRA